jgi:ribosome biogenesis GTPase
LWDNSGEGLASAFPEIIVLAAGCRFRDCRHEGEPGCAVQAALERRELPADRFASFGKLRAELEARQARAGRSSADPRRTAPRVRGRRIMRG